MIAFLVTIACILALFVVRRSKTTARTARWLTRACAVVGAACLLLMGWGAAFASRTSEVVEERVHVTALEATEYQATVRAEDGTEGQRRLRAHVPVLGGAADAQEGVVVGRQTVSRVEPWAVRWVYPPFLPREDGSGWEVVEVQVSRP